MSSEITTIGFQRDFQIWLYTVGHAQLLLRSNRSSQHGTRVDVLFKGVEAIQLPTILCGLSIIRASRPEAIKTAKRMGVSLRENGNVFVLPGANYVGSVISSVAYAHEDEGFHGDPSYFTNSFLPKLQP